MAEPGKSAGELLEAIERLGIHNHACLLYKNRQEQFAAAIPFIKMGLERREKCVYIADDNSAETVLGALKAEGVDVEAAVASGALAVVTKLETYLKAGAFDPDAMIGFLKESTEAAKAAGFKALRATGEMTWALGPEPGVERLIEYESKLNDFITHNDVLAICQYNTTRFDADVLLGVIRTHPTAIIGDVVGDNPYYVPPSEYPHPPPHIELERTLGHIVQRERTQSDLRDTLSQARQQQEEIAALLEASKSVLKYREFTDAAKEIFKACKELIGATGGYTALVSKDGAENEVLFLDSGGLPCTVDESLPMPIRGLRAESYRGSRTVYDNDFARSRWAQYLPEGHVELENVLFAPLLIEGEAVGLMGLANKPGGFTDEDIRRASAFADIAAIALTNSRLLESIDHSEERFRALTESAGDAIVSADSHGRITQWNAAAGNIFGYDADEVIGEPITIIMPERFREAHQAGIERFISTGKKAIIDRVVELSGLRKDGGEFPLELSLSTWQTRDGTFFTGIIRDISKRKAVEKTIHDQQEAISKLSTPILQVGKDLLAIPIIGQIDSYRARQLTEQMLIKIRDTRAKIVVLDITGVPIVDSAVANHLVQTVQAARLLGARVIVTGVSAENAQTLVRIGVDLSRLKTTIDLQGGIKASEKLLRSMRGVKHEAA